MNNLPTVFIFDIRPLVERFRDILLKNYPSGADHALTYLISKSIEDIYLIYTDNVYFNDSRSLYSTYKQELHSYISSTIGFQLSYAFKGDRRIQIIHNFYSLYIFRKVTL